MTTLTRPSPTGTWVEVTDGPKADAIETGCRRLFYLGVLTMPLLTFRVAAGLTLSDILLLVSVALLALAPNPRSGLQQTGFRAFLGLLILLGGVLAAERSQFPTAALIATAKVVYVIAVLPWQCRRVLVDRRQLTTAIVCFTIGATICAAGAMAQARFGDVIPNTNPVYGRFPGFTQHVSDLGGILATAVPLTIGAIVAANRRGRFLYALVLLPCLYGLILCGSVSGMFGSVLGMFTLLARRAVRPRYLVMLIIVIVLGYQGATVLQHGTQYSQSPLQRLLQVTGVQAENREAVTVASRLDTDKYALGQIAKNPIIGAGLDENSGRTPYEGLPAHNLLLVALWQGGLLVFGAAVAALALTAKRAWRRDIQFPAREQLVAAFVSGLFFSMTAPSLFNRYFWIIPALLVAANEIRHRETSSD